MHIDWGIALKPGEIVVVVAYSLGKNQPVWMENVAVLFQSFYRIWGTWVVNWDDS